MKRFVSLLALFALLACEKEIDFEIPDPGKRIVMETRMVTDETIELFLSESVYSLSAARPGSRDDFQALLYTTDPNSPFEFFVAPYNIGFEPQHVYRLAYDLEPGEEYRIVVKGEGFPDASATERVPTEVNVLTFAYDQEEKEFTFSFKDDSRTEDYYMISVNELDNDDLTISSLDLDLEFFEFDGFFGDDDFDGRQFGTQAFLSDQGFNGDSRLVKVKVEEPTDAVFIELRVHKVSESFYRHELTKAAYDQNDGFFTEPVQVFSNVNNGYGIMATASSFVQQVQY